MSANKCPYVPFQMAPTDMVIDEPHWAGNICLTERSYDIWPFPVHVHGCVLSQIFVSNKIDLSCVRLACTAKSKHHKDA